MDYYKTNINKDIPVDLGWRLFNYLSKIDTQVVSFIILILLSAQVFVGLFEPTLSKSALIALYYGKTTLIRFLGFLGIVNYLIDFYCRVFIHRKKAIIGTLLKRPWVGLFTILLLWSAIAIGAAMDKNMAMFGSAYRYEGFVSYLAYAGIFLNAALIKDEKFRKKLFIFVAICSTALAGITLVKELTNTSILMNRGGQVDPYSATFINSNHYGYYLCVSMIIIASLFMYSEKLRSRIIYGACFALNMVVLLYNASLGPYVALSIGLVVLFVFWSIRKGIKKTLILLIIVAIFVGLSFVINDHRMITDLKLVITETSDVISVVESGEVSTQEGQQIIDNTGSGRGVLWRKTIDVIAKNPIIGIGTDNIPLHIGNHIPHNEYLQIGSTLGIPGLVIYLAALISLFAYAMKNLKKISDGVLIAVVAVMVYCFSAFVGISIPIATYQLFLYMGLLSGWFKHRDETKLSEQVLAELNKKEEDNSDTKPEEIATQQ